MYGSLDSGGVTNWLFRQGVAQEVLKAQPALFLSANDRFGYALLKIAHESGRDRNIVISPLPISLSFAVLTDVPADPESTKEILAAFHWDHPAGIIGAARMILQRFERPKLRPLPTSLPIGVAKPEEVWLSAAFMHFPNPAYSPDVMQQIKYDTGLPFLCSAKGLPLWPPP